MTKIPLYVGLVHFAVALVALIELLFAEDKLAPVVRMLTLDFPVSYGIVSVTFWLFPPDPVTHLSTFASHLTLGISFLILGSIWYFLVAAALMTLATKQSVFNVIRRSLH